MSCDHEPSTPSERSTHDTELDDILAGFIDRMNAGERLLPEQVLAEHPSRGREILDLLADFIELDSPDSAPLGTVGDYTLRRQIGRGGMGVVYEAWQNSMKRRVALKVLPRGFAADTRAVTRFVREAQVAGKLLHPNIVAVYGMGVEEKVPYFSMEYVEGKTLAEAPSPSVLFGKSPPGPADGTQAQGQLDASDASSAYFKRIAESIAAVADGLEHAHRNGIIHRDIKPSNLIVDKAGQLRILDFGLARIEGAQSLTRTGDFLGTVLYVSPEQAMARRVPVDHRTDIYSLGATLYEIIAGEPPFKGKTHQDTLGQIIFQDPRSPRRTKPHIPRDLETIVLKCLRKDPRDRYHTAEALAQDLKRYASGAAIEARPQPAWERLARRIWRRKLRIAVVVLLGMILLVFAHLLSTGGGKVHRLVWDAPPDAYVNAVSPDGRYISYVDLTTGDLAIHDLTTGANRHLTNGGSAARCREYADWSAFSPDSTRIAYSWFNEDGFFELRTVSLDGTSLRTLCRDEQAEDLWPDEWSPDGRQIAVCIEKTGGTHEIALVSVAAGSLQVLKSLKDCSPEALTFSPDGKFLACDFVPDSASGRDIFLLAIDGSGEIPIVQEAGDDLLVDWVADGSGILFQHDRAGRAWIGRSGAGDIWFLEIVAGRPRGVPVPVARGMGEVSSLGHTRSGTWFYSLPGEPVRRLYVASIDCESGEILASPALASSHTRRAAWVDWAPDGEHLAYLKHRWFSSTVFLVNARTHDERQLSPELSMIDEIRWSPDGKLFIAYGGDEERGEGIYRIDAQTGAATLVVGGGVTLPLWSPDGTAVFYRLKSEESRLIRRKLATGREREVIPDLQSGREYAVSPDGKTVAYSEKDEATGEVLLKLLPVAGGEARAIFRVRPADYIGDLSFTPDGRYVIAVVESTSDVRAALGPWRIPVEGGEPLRLLFSVGTVHRVRVHPDGTRIALIASPERTEVWAMEKSLPIEAPTEETRSP